MQSHLYNSDRSSTVGVELGPRTLVPQMSMRLLFGFAALDAASAIDLAAILISEALPAERNKVRRLVEDALEKGGNRGWCHRFTGDARIVLDAGGLRFNQTRFSPSNVRTDALLLHSATARKPSPVISEGLHCARRPR